MTDSNNIQILCISETFLSANKNIHNFQNFNRFRYDRDLSIGDKSKGGGVAILVKRGINSTEYTLHCRDVIHETSNLEIVATKI